MSQWIPTSFELPTRVDPTSRPCSKMLSFLWLDRCLEFPIQRWQTWLNLVSSSCHINLLLLDERLYFLAKRRRKASNAKLEKAHKSSQRNFLPKQFCKAKWACMILKITHICRSMQSFDWDALQFDLRPHNSGCSQIPSLNHSVNWIFVKKIFFS